MNLLKFKASLKKLFVAKSEQDKLDEFITNQRPTTVNEVEYWTDVYDRRRHNSQASTYFHYTGR